MSGNGETVLVTGGAGYIGSHAVWALHDAGIQAVVIDDLSTGCRANLPQDVTFLLGNAGDRAFVAGAIAAHCVGAVMHFAGSIVVPESVEKPIDYFKNNTVASLSLIEACVKGGVKRFIFSSTAAVYGNPDYVPIPEDHPTRPESPYGDSKLMTETCLKRVAAAHGLKYGILRYFNVAGADPQLRTGQLGPQATHLIKIASQVVSGKRDHLDIFGTDYDTADGTAERDYIHVSDLVDAHVLALRYLGGGDSFLLNCGYGHGYSVRDVVSAFERVTGRVLPTEEAPRRAGDVPRLIAESGAIKARLGWQPKLDDLDVIVAHAIKWEQKLKEQGR